MKFIKRVGAGFKGFGKTLAAFPRDFRRISRDQTDVAATRTACPPRGPACDNFAWGLRSPTDFGHGPQSGEHRQGEPQGHQRQR